VALRFLDNLCTSGLLYICAHQGYYIPVHIRVTIYLCTAGLLYICAHQGYYISLHIRVTIYLCTSGLLYILNLRRCGFAVYFPGIIIVAMILGEDSHVTQCGNYFVEK
jgi:hypothetical protein